MHSAACPSLFAERRLTELRLPSGKPGKEGSRALCDYLATASAEDVLLIVSGKIDKQSTNSKWYKALDKAGATIQIWPVKARDMPGWLRQRLHSADMDIDKDALQLLSDRVEGNLLAAVQEVEKLKLLAQGDRITLQTVTEAVANNARYNPFDLVESALQGDVSTSLRILHGLRGEGAEPLMLLWALARDIRTLYAVQLDCDQGQRAQQALSSRGVWKSRIPVLQSALSRHNANSLSQLLEAVFEVDGSVKGFADGRPWDKLERLITQFCQTNG